MARMAPIPLEECPDPDLRATLEHFTTTLGLVPNSLLTMQRVPAIAGAVVQLNRAVFETFWEAQMLIERWQVESNTIRPHSSLGYWRVASEKYFEGGTSLQRPWNLAVRQVFTTFKERTLCSIPMSNHF